MIEFNEIPDGESWELFARDFLSEFGFFIESPPDRGADGGKDMLITEELEGRVGRYKFRWLTSGKHYAASGKSVNETDEGNILERIRSFDADGFIGFYSTVPSAALNTRLAALKRAGEIKDYRFFDSRLIENYLVRVGYSEIMLRYLPKSYKRIRPLHNLVDEYIPLRCEICDRDVLASIHENKYDAIVVFARGRVRDGDDYHRHVEEVHVLCKRECDRTMVERLRAKQLIDAWEDIGDLGIPLFYIRWVFSHLNSLRDGLVTYSDEAYEKVKIIIMALGQRTLRETTEAESARVGRLVDLPV